MGTLALLIATGKADSPFDYAQGRLFANDNKKYKDKYEGKGEGDLLAGVDQGLPEFDAVALGVGDPGEAAIARVFAVGVDGDVGGG
jgi:hypothetical protein